MIAAAGIVQINVAVDVMFTSYMQEGATFALNTADRVMELVLGGYAIAIGTVVLPMLSRSVAAGAVETMRSTLNFAYRMILLVTVPAATGLIVLREPIIQVLFEHGEFDTADTLLTAQPLLYFAIGLVAFSVMKVMIPAFYSLQDTKTPVRIAFFAMLLNVLLNFAFFRPLGVGGPALATSLAGVFSAGALTLLFVRRKGGIGLYSILSSVARFAVGSVLLALVAAWMIAIPGFYDGQSLAARIVALGATIAVAGAVYFAAVAALRCPEVTEVRQVLRGRGKEEESGP
jgi:putative peptidoglycan lipid II flippase